MVLDHKASPLLSFNFERNIAHDLFVNEYEKEALRERHSLLHTLQSRFQFSGLWADVTLKGGTDRIIWIQVCILSLSKVTLRQHSDTVDL